MSPTDTDVGPNELVVAELVEQRRRAQAAEERGAIALAAALPQRVPVSEVSVGQTGYGLTVFEDVVGPSAVIHPGFDLLFHLPVDLASVFADVLDARLEGDILLAQLGIAQG